MATLLETKRLVWAVTFALVTVMALLAYFAGKRYLAAVRAVEHTMAVQTAIHATLTSLVDAETGHRGYLLTGDERFLEPLHSAERELPREFAQLQKLTAGDAEQGQRLTAMRRLSDQKLSFSHSTQDVRRAGRFEDAIMLVGSGRGKQLMDQIRAHCRGMLDHEEQRLVQRKSEAQQAERLAAMGVGIGTLLMVLLALVSLLTVNRDVEELRRTADELSKSEEHYRLLTEQSSDLVRLLSLDGRVSYVSPSVERILGYDAAEYLKLPPLSLMHPSEIEAAKGILNEVKNGTQSEGVSTYRLRHKNGEYRWFEVRWAALRSASGELRELHTAARDVTERREAEQQLNSYAKQLRALAIRDELTGLYNRRGFSEVAGQAHSRALRDSRPAALIFMDLNGMKRINDELGHDIGDQALVDTADVLTSGMREADVLARLGGDEFVVFALDFGASDLEPLRRRLRELADARVAAHARPFRLSMSVGVAFVDPAVRSTLEELLERADAAMYEQKNARRAAGSISIPPPAAND
jgi:diguanylate cyclase (GGDEF)-like protein/PAS domain S-box-containing protein